MPFDPELFGQAMGEEIRKAAESLRAEIADLRKQLADAKAQAPDVRQMVADEVAKIPAPSNGKDADESAIADRVAQSIKADLEQWKADAQGAIEVPELPDIKGMVESAVSVAVKSLPAPESGKSVTLGDVRPLLDEAIKQLRQDADEAIAEPLRMAEAARDALLKAVGELRQPEDGESITVDDVRPLIEAEVEKAVRQIPAPKDGIGMAGSMIDRDGNLIITLTNGEAKNLGPVVGRDGLSLESFEMRYDADAHEVVLKASSAGRSQEVRYPAGGIRGKGYWRDGKRAMAGDAWTHEGSLWLAKADTSEEPSSKSGDWILAARKGRDGESIVKRIKEGPEHPIRLDG